MAELVIVHIVEVRQLRQRGPLLHQVPTARRPANRLQDVLGGEGWEIHALGSGQRDGFTCPSHVLGLIQGIGCIRPFAFAARPSAPARPTGFPSMARRLHLYISAFPDWEFVSAYAATQLHPQRTTPLHGYTPTGLHAAAQPNGGRAAHGRPRAMLPFLREVPSGPPESRLHLQAFIRNRAARLKIPGLNREASPAFPLTLCVNIKRRARASAFAETRAKICATEMTG